MKVIGLTGGIGTGKSTVARFLAELGAVVIDVDMVGHEALRPGGNVARQVVAAFGREVLNERGEIDRTRLGGIVFGNPQARERLNAIIHPAMHDMVTESLDRYRRQGENVIVLDAPLLLDAGWDSLVDEIWVTVTPEETILRRLKEYRGMPAAEAKARIKAQLPSKERQKRASVVIDNRGDLPELQSRVRELWQRLQSRVDIPCE